AHLLHLLAQCRTDQSETHYATIPIDFRRHAGIPQNTLGNCVDAVMLQFDRPHSPHTLASAIQAAVKGYVYNPSIIWNFVEEQGGIRKSNRVIPNDLLPRYKNLIISSWTNFGVYSIDLGAGLPSIFLPTGEIPLPWFSCISEGFHNRGLIIALSLPSHVGKRLSHPSMLDKIHSYRGAVSSEDAASLKQSPWCI
ncbi:MAG TPA: hypothetical protein VLF94_00430, partial [Chlamydiales bacterium]|nr:hypothetical protein [Chlamydiales bacterium]